MLLKLNRLAIKANKCWWRVGKLKLSYTVKVCGKQVQVLREMVFATPPKVSVLWSLRPSNLFPGTHPTEMKHTCTQTVPNVDSPFVYRGLMLETSKISNNRWMKQTSSGSATQWNITQLWKSNNAKCHSRDESQNQWRGQTSKSAPFDSIYVKILEKMSLWQCIPGLRVENIF